MNESQSHDFVAIASVLNAAWEIQREYGQSNLDFLSEFVSSDGDDSSIDKGSVDIQRLHEKAKEYFIAGNFKMDYVTMYSRTPYTG